MAKSCIIVCFTNSLRMAIFWTHISQGSVATRLGCGWVFVYDFVTNFLLSLTVKEFWKSVNIWWSSGQELGVLFFRDSQCKLITATDSWGAEYCADRVCVFDREHISRTTRPIFANFCACALWPRLSPPLALCDRLRYVFPVLCDVMFAQWPG